MTGVVDQCAAHLPVGPAGPANEQRRISNLMRSRATQDPPAVRVEEIAAARQARLPNADSQCCGGKVCKSAAYRIRQCRLQLLTERRNLVASRLAFECRVNVRNRMGVRYRQPQLMVSQAV